MSEKKKKNSEENYEPRKKRKKTPYDEENIPTAFRLRKQNKAPLEWASQMKKRNKSRVINDALEHYFLYLLGEAAMKKYNEEDMQEKS